VILGGRGRLGYSEILGAFMNQVWDFSENLACRLKFLK
jgi:hypothetical protein